MKLQDLNFDLPERLIARYPATERRDARLLVVHPHKSAWQHAKFANFCDYLEPRDLLVLNDTKVLPARLCLNKTTGGQIEGLFLYESPGGNAHCMLSGGRLRPGVELVWHDEPVLRLANKLERGCWELENLSQYSWPVLLGHIGATPLPPYIRRLRVAASEAEDSAIDRQRYQTIWAEQEGSVAAPTASLHFDQAMLSALEEKGVRMARLTLHVGQGTFLPIETEQVEDHPMHAEAFEVGANLAADIETTKRNGGRVIAAGTTVCRALEGWALKHVGQTDLMILPGFPFQVVDGLLTNFHTPQSTLLALVGAMAAHQGANDGLGLVKKVYAAAIKSEYHFFSYGDASLWLPSLSPPDHAR